MRCFLSLVVSVLAVGCTHVQRAAEPAVTAFDVMNDEEIARLAIREALGTLHQVQQIDPETGVVTVGRSAFSSRDERLAFERRVDQVLRARVYGQGPTLELVRIHCEKLQRTGWAAWPRDAEHGCDYGDQPLTLHSLYKKPGLHRAYVELMLGVVDSPKLSEQTRAALLALQHAPVEPYLFVVEAWERVEGFRPRS